jgi:hypothetical protein
MDAKEIIKLRDREYAAQSNFRDLWQDTADLMFPRENQINDKTTPGEDKTRKRYDSTAVFDSFDMASGLSGSMIPSGQKFFGFTVENEEISSIDEAQRWLSQVTRITHTELFKSNFMLQLNETLRSLIVFGTGNLFSEWDAQIGKLNFKDYDIANYLFLENPRGTVDTVILSFKFTPKQAVQEFPNISDDIKRMAESQSDEKIKFIHIVKPREIRNSNLSDNLNMPFESIIVEEKGQDIVREEGFDENPFAVARWMKSSSEKWGRGQGTEILSDVKMLNQMKYDFNECSNRWNNPPLEVLETFEGQVSLTPGSLNYVQQTGTIKGVQTSALGNFPITVEALNEQKELIHRAFFRDIFRALSDLKGDRRTQLEISELLKEGLRLLGLPIYRIQTELLGPAIDRSFMLLMRNGRIPPAPQVLEGQVLSIEYEGELALALKNQEAKGAQAWVGMVGEIEQIEPGVKDNINFDKVVRRQGRILGVNPEDMATAEEVLAKREARAQQLQEQKALEMAAMAAEGYGKTNQAPEAGSPAGEVMEALA